MSKTSANFNNHYFVVDLLKTIAVQIIILHHLSNYGIIPFKVYEIFPRYMEFIGDYGRYAVQIFLVIGGYLSCKNLSRTLEKIGFFKTVINRYLRLVPSYIVTLAITMICASLARSVHYEEYIGGPETFTQILAHVFFMQKILGFESISVGVWYMAIDWQLYIFISLLLFTFKDYQFVLRLLIFLIIACLFYFSLDARWEDYFIYFISAYALGILAFLAQDNEHVKTQLSAKMAIVLFTLLILADTLFEIHIKNILDILVALVLFWKGRFLYHFQQVKWTKICIWFSQRSYCAFLIHFSILLLGNTLFYQLDLHSPWIAFAMMISIWCLSWIAAHFLYILVEFPSRKIQLK
jgi:peptidoglycan/LPS O-acetylase OafA/YrhL